MDERELLLALQQELELPPVPNPEPEQFRLALAGHINDLVLHDFNRLISLLYRLDISEAKLRKLLKENPGTQASLIIADLVIERQRQKMKSRKESKRDPDIPDAEKW